MTVRIMGFNLSHDSSAALIEDGRIISALALERTTRVKRGTVAQHLYAAKMSDLTCEILDSSGLTSSDIDYWIASSTESRDQHDEDYLLSILGLLTTGAKRLSLPHPGHHLAHASAAFYSSGFDNAAALVIDAYGSRLVNGREQESGFFFSLSNGYKLIFRNQKEQWRIAGKLERSVMYFPKVLSGIGELYRVITIILGFREKNTNYDDAGKTMGLASFGQPFSKHAIFIAINNGEICYKHATEQLEQLGLLSKAASGYRVSHSISDNLQRLGAANLAAQIQMEFENACIFLVQTLLERTNSKNLVLSGGCFLNSVTNTRIKMECDVDDMFVFPAATDDGNAIGSALFAHHNLLDTPQRFVKTRRLKDVYFGPPRLKGLDIDKLTRKFCLHSVDHGSTDSVAAAAALAISRGEIIGWFQDRSEFGPRSLGARSILAHPGVKGMKDRLNSRVKFREAFRPFAASILEEDASSWFIMPELLSPFMLMVCKVRQDKADSISQIVHVDTTCRLQTVDEESDTPFRKLIEKFGVRTGIPLVLNTSFNLRGMPIVETPSDAIECLFGARLDRIFIGQFEIPAPDHLDFSLVSLDLSGKFDEHVMSSLEKFHPAFKEADAKERCWLADKFISNMNGSATLAEISAILDMPPLSMVDMALELRLKKIVRWSSDQPKPLNEGPPPQYQPNFLS